MSLNFSVNLRVNMCVNGSVVSVVNKSVKSESFDVVYSTIKKSHRSFIFPPHSSIPCLVPLVAVRLQRLLGKVFGVLFTFVHLCQYTVAAVLGEMSQRTQ